jgi:hypothetical protein
VNVAEIYGKGENDGLQKTGNLFWVNATPQSFLNATRLCPATDNSLTASEYEKE